MPKKVETKQSIGVFETFTGTFRKLTSSGAQETHAGSHLASMNVPHWLAKRDAAYEGAVVLINNNLATRSNQQRQNNYSKIFALLNLACKAHYRIQASIKENEEVPKNQNDYIGQYLSLLISLTNAAASLLDVEIIMNSEENNSVSTFVGNQGFENLKIISLTCMEDANKLHESIINLISSTKQTIEKEESKAKKMLPKIEKERYDEAFKELQTIYTQTDIEEENTG